MRAKTNLLLTILLTFNVLYSTWGQKYCPDNTPCEVKKVVHDFNNDKVLDKLFFSSYYNNLSFTGWQITDGRTKRNYKLTRIRLDNCIKSYTWLPNGFERAGLESIVDYTVMKNYDYEGLVKRKKPDGSLQWLINYAYSDDIICDSIIKVNIVKPVFTSEDPHNLTYYYVKLKGDTLEQLYKKEKGCSTRNEDYKDLLQRPSQSSSALIFYWGYGFFNLYNHVKIDSLYDPSEKKFIKVFLTDHGLYIEKNGQYGWVYVSDFCLTGSSTRQRWASTENIKIINGLILINGLGVSTKIVDIMSGRIGFLQNGFLLKVEGKEKISLIKWAPPGNYITVKEMNPNDLLNMLMCK